VNKMNLVNEKAILSDNAFIREAYKFDLFLQIVLTSVNGVTLMSNDKYHKNEDTNKHGAVIGTSDEAAIEKRNELPIANIYFKFAHKEKNAQDALLTNKY
jgi:hypothetical protein